MKEKQREALLKANMKRSYTAYTSRIARMIIAGRGIRKPLSEAAYYYKYEQQQELKSLGFKVKNIAEEFFKKKIVFSIKEAKNLTTKLLEATSNIKDLQEAGLNIESLKGSEIQKAILSLSPEAAHNFVSNAIDLGIFSSGDEFKGYTY